MMTYSQACASVIGTLSDLAFRDALTVGGLQLAHAYGAELGDDQDLDERTRAAAAWLRDQAAAELLMVESCYRESA